jgi:hypothetical protein
MSYPDLARCTLKHRYSFSGWSVEKNKRKKENIPHINPTLGRFTLLP